MGKWSENELMVLKETYPFVGRNCTRYVNRYCKDEVKRSKHAVSMKANRENLWKLKIVDGSKIEAYPCILNNMTGVFIPHNSIFQDTFAIYEFLHFMTGRHFLLRVIGDYKEPFSYLRQEWLPITKNNMSEICMRNSGKSVMGIFFTEIVHEKLKLPIGEVPITYKLFLDLEAYIKPEPNIEIIRETAGVDLKSRGSGIRFYEAAEPMSYIDYGRNLPTIREILKEDYLDDCHRLATAKPDYDRLLDSLIK